MKFPPPMPGRNWIPGVPGAGHLSTGGFWHPGAINNCRKAPCYVECRQCSRREHDECERPQRRCDCDHPDHRRNTNA